MPVETHGAAFHLAPKSFRPGYLAPYCNRGEMTWGRNDRSPFKLNPRVLSRIYHLGEKSRVGEGHELPRGFWGMPPGNI